MYYVLFQDGGYGMNVLCYSNINGYSSSRHELFTTFLAQYIKCTKYTNSYISLQHQNSHIHPIINSSILQMAKKKNKIYMSQSLWQIGRPDLNVFLLSP